jgi:hypothetical protein
MSDVVDGTVGSIVLVALSALQPFAGLEILSHRPQR